MNKADFKRLAYQEGDLIYSLNEDLFPINIVHKLDRVWFTLRLHGFAIGFNIFKFRSFRDINIQSIK